LRRWLVELGYLNAGRNSYLVDPTRAIRGAIWDLKGLLTARTFVESIRLVVPTGLGHPLCIAVQGGDKQQHGDLSLFPAISYGLQRLARTKAIELSTLDDGAERMVLHFPSGTDQPMGVTHVEVVK